MKFATAVAKSLLMAASIGMVVPLMAQTPPKPDEPKKEKADKIEGLTIARKDGRFLGLTVEGVQFKLRFYDSKKKPEKVDAARAAVRWTPVSVKGEQRVILNTASDGMSLVSPGLVKPPLNFRAFFTLFSASEQAMDTFWVDLSELGKASKP